MCAAVPLRILFVEDIPEDVLLAERELRRDGFDFVSHVVETEADFIQALSSFEPDLIISDYGLPSFNGMQALALSLAHDPMLPFIIVTGSLNEETAVQCMKSGATEYVIKDRIARLPFAVKEALDQKTALRNQRKTENALRESEMRYKSLFENSSAVMLLIDPNTGQIVDVNSGAQE